MLRYQQDYKPVERDTAARFVDALLAAGMEKEAVNWFSQLDDASPLKLLVRLKTGLIAPDAAVAQARAALAKSNQAAYWAVLQQAAALQKDPVLQVEALENLLQLAGDKPAQRLAAIATDLWKSYAAAAQDVANQNQLLVGEDAGWEDLAARRSAASATAGRALFAYLVQHGKIRATRQSAQLQLVFSLQTAKLALAALRLFDDATRFPVAQIDPQARFLLGGMAADNNQPAAAARYWQGLATPPTLDPDEWRIRLATVLVRAGSAEPGADVLRALIAGKKTLPADVMQRAVAAVQELQDGGFSKTADELYRALLPLAAARERRDILFALARIAESGNDFQNRRGLFSGGGAPARRARPRRVRHQCAHCRGRESRPRGTQGRRARPVRVAAQERQGRRQAGSDTPRNAEASARHRMRPHCSMSDAIWSMVTKAGRRVDS